MVHLSRPFPSLSSPYKSWPYRLHFPMYPGFHWAHSTEGTGGNWKQEESIVPPTYPADFSRKNCTRPLGKPSKLPADPPASVSGLQCALSSNLDWAWLPLWSLLASQLPVGFSAFPSPLWPVWGTWFLLFWIFSFLSGPSLTDTKNHLTLPHLLRKKRKKALPADWNATSIFH